MKILVVSAHPDPASLTNALRGVAVDQLEADGHEVRVTDLYAMGWKSAVDRADFPALPAAARLQVPAASSAAFATGTLTDDVTAEQAKLIWADALILAFPLWWFSMPAILKGWIDRVYAYGFAYGVGEHSATRWGDRYGEGTLAGKRAMLVVTAGGWEPHYGPRGINGPISTTCCSRSSTGCCSTRAMRCCRPSSSIGPTACPRAPSRPLPGACGLGCAPCSARHPSGSGGRTAVIMRSRPWRCTRISRRIATGSLPIWTRRRRAPARHPDRAHRTAQRGVAASRHGRIVSGRGF